MRLNLNPVYLRLQNPTYENRNISPSISIISKGGTQNDETRDHSIIEVSNEKFETSIFSNSFEDQFTPPYWEKTYVYSYDEIHTASKEQKQFYDYLKKQVLAGNEVNIRGNTNYVFILYFDFLKEYKKHNDIQLLEKQFKTIGEICRKTKPYTLQILKEELIKRNDRYSVEKLKSLNDAIFLQENDYTDYNPDLYKLGNIYQKKLQLNKQEVRLLNKFYNPNNVFSSIEGCCIAIIKQYLSIVKELHKACKKKESTLHKEVMYLVKKRISADSNAYNREYFYANQESYLKAETESDIFLAIYKRVENSVRDTFRHKRKLDTKPFYDESMAKEFEDRLGFLLDALIKANQINITLPDNDTQIELNTQNVNRWKSDFELLKPNIQDGNIGLFKSGIHDLEEVNQKNPNIEHIFFEASKFIAKYDKVQSLKYYAKYVMYDLKSKKIDNKELPKSVQKVLFKTTDQTQNFACIIDALNEHKDIEKALKEIDVIYIPKRKLIKLNKSQIKETEQNHEGTVALLDGYLNSQEEEPRTIDNQTKETVSVEENEALPDTNKSSIDQIQEELLTRIANNAFEITQNEVAQFATDHGMLKNQLVDSINKKFEEALEGEALIEEEDENYIIEESYYNEITNQS